MIHKAAGIAFVAPQDKVLFLKRGPGGDFPGYWCFPGGTAAAGETPEQTAKREATEELGNFPAGKLVYHTRSIQTTDAPDTQVDFTTFLQKVDAEFAPQLNGEHVGHAWAPISQPPEPLHPGCRVALDRFGWNELGVARAMRDGLLTSPQLYMNVWLFDMRITGTGVAYRSQKTDDKGNVIQPEEFVYRRPENYLTSDFVERCNGLQVLMLHTKTPALTSKEFQARSVGAMMLPYIKGDEVWGIAKIYDDSAVQALNSMQLSTSPGVLISAGAQNQRMVTEDGTPLLIEGEACLLDHLAICERGVWDKGGEPVGVRLDSQGDSTMLTDEDKKVLDDRIAAAVAAAMATSMPALIKAGLADVRHDDNGTSGKLDALLNGMTALSTRMDAMEKKDSKSKFDSAACFGPRQDSESDDDYKKRHDADEENFKKDAMEKGASEEAASKAAKDARKDSEEKEDKARKDAEEAAKKDAAAKHDAVPRSEFDRLVAANIELATQLKAVQANMPRALTDGDRAAFSSAQAKHDEVYSGFGKKAPFPMTAETVLDYRKRLTNGLKQHSAAWKDVDVLALHDAAFAVAEAQILKDAAHAALHPADLQAGELREIVRQDSATGVRTIEFRGQNSFIHGMKRPPRYVKRIGAATQART